MGYVIRKGFWYVTERKPGPYTADVKLARIYPTRINAECNIAVPDAERVEELKVPGAPKKD